MGTPARVGALALVLSACQQSDQELPFDLEGAGLTTTIGVSGGLVSVPPSFSMQFPSGSLPGATQVTAATRLTAFPSTAGTVIPGTTFDVGPEGVLLNVPARVQLAVPAAVLDAGEELQLSVALLRSGGSIVTDVTSYDLSNGILTAEVDEVGPVAAVIALDALPVLDLVDITSLGGGSVSPPSPAPLPAGPAQAPGDPVFVADCSGNAQSCFSSGILQVWVNEVVRDRLGDEMVLLNTTVDAHIDFLAFNQLGLPTQVLGSVEVDGELRARLNSVVAGRRLGDELLFHTGPAGFPPAATTVTFSGNTMTLAQTSEGPNESVVYGVTGIGTGEQLTLRIEGEIEFSNPSETGQVVVHVRLRR